MSFIAGLGLGAFLECGVAAVIVCGLIYAVLAWSFAQRHRWAWIALTILELQPYRVDHQCHLPAEALGGDPVTTPAI